MKTIDPVFIWVNGTQDEGTILNAYCINDNLSTSGTFYYSILSDAQQQLAQGNLTMTGEDYQAWQTNDYAYDWVAAQLNLTITGDYVPPVPYHLSKLSKEVEKEIEQLTESEKELFKKYFGETEPEQTKEFFESEAFINYSTDRAELFDEEIDFKDFSFSIDDLDFKSSESYPTFIELFLK